MAEVVDETKTFTVKLVKPPPGVALGLVVGGAILVIVLGAVVTRKKS